MSNEKMTLEDYFRKCYAYAGGTWQAGNAIDHNVRHCILDGEIQFYIHPSGVSGETLTFRVQGNELVSV